MNELWTHLAMAAGISLDPSRHSLLSRYLDLLLEANATMNLTRITDRSAAEVQHIGDALTLLPFLPKGPHTLADIGSGGGVPGLPLAIARPDARVILIESTRKKADFLQRTAAELGLTNVQIRPQRAEEAGQSDLRDACDVVTARAVGALNLLVEWTLPLVKKGGRVLAMKGARVAEELPAALRPIKILNGAEPIVHPVALPGAEHHVIVEIVKLGKTNPRYPRSATVAKGKPVGE